MRMDAPTTGIESARTTPRTTCAGAGVAASTSAIAV